MKDGLGATQGWITIASTFVRNVRSKQLSGGSYQIAYNILLALGPLLTVPTASCGFMTQQMTAESANPVKPVTDWLNINLIRA